MRVLLDACVPRRLVGSLPEHQVRTAPELGWGDLDDGPLLEAMSGRFDALVTVDRALAKQQKIADRPFAVVLLRARSNRLADLLPLVPRLTEVLNAARPGHVYEVSG
jgi:predicted nuclease of predicted toxin-antitoxin system